MAELTKPEIAGFAAHIERMKRVRKKLKGNLSFFAIADGIAADILDTPKDKHLHSLATEFRTMVVKMEGMPAGPNRDELVFMAGQTYNALELRSGLGGARERAYLASVEGQDEARKSRAFAREKDPETLKRLEDQAKNLVWSCLSAGKTKTHGKKDDPGIYEIVWPQIKAKKKEDVADHLTARELKRLIPIARDEYEQRRKKSPAAG